MRIFYTFPFRLGVPGIGTTAAEQIRAFVRAGHDVTVCAAGVTAAAADLRDLGPQTLEVLGRKVPHRAVGWDRAIAWHDSRAARLLRRSGPYDVVHAWPLAALTTGEAARELGIPLFREVPNTHTAYAYARVAQELEQLGLGSEAGGTHVLHPRRLDRELQEYELADVILAPSEFARRTFVEQGVDPAKLRLHRYGCDLEKFRPAAAERRGAPFRAVFVGRCEPRKGLHYALEAWHASAARDRGELVIAGAFGHGYEHVLRKRLDHPSVDVRGFVSDTPRLFREADVLLLPSVEEGSALVTYEALATGCVPLVSEAAGARCIDGVDGFVHDVGDVAALTAHLDELVRDEARLRRMQAVARARRDDLSWDAAAADLVSTYAEPPGQRRP